MVLCRDWAHRQVNHEGSHIILQTDTPRSHRLSVPDHSPLRIGTLNAILRAVAEAKNTAKEDVLRSF
jgi:predicted RNA binding protein YcfA (HicA-like mRNA interferase family)